jgi:hypothetical protein
MQGWFVAHYDAFKDFAGPTLTLLGFATTIGIAVAGFRTFDRWKKQKIEGKTIEVAFDALAMCYESKYIFENIRSPMSFDYEWKDMPKAAGESDVSWNRRGPFYAVGQGVRANKYFFNRVFTLQQHCMAALGPEYEGIFMLLHKSRREIEVSSEMLAWKAYNQDGAELEHNEAFYEQCRRDIWDVGDFQREKDKGGQRLVEFRNRMEKLCRPIVDKEYRRTERKRNRWCNK